MKESILILATILLLVDGFGVGPSLRTTKPALIGSSFVPKSRSLLPPPGSNGRPTNDQKLCMLIEMSGGKMELEEYVEAAPLKQVRKTPSMLKWAGLATVPVSAALGFVSVPSRRLAAHAVGAAITAVGGLVGKSKIDDVGQSAALPAIAQVIVDHNLEDKQEIQRSIREAAAQFSVHEEDLPAICSEVYRMYLIGMLKYQNKPKTSDLKELENLRAALQMDSVMVGEAHKRAAERWYIQTCQFTPKEDLEDPEHPDRLAMGKLLFLTERTFRGAGETEEAFTFEMTRTAKAVNLTLDQAMERVGAVAESFYERALQSARSKLDTNQITPDRLARARETLGIDIRSAQEMHHVALNEEIKSLLGMPEDVEDLGDMDLSTLKFPEGTIDRLKALVKVLSLSEADVRFEINEVSNVLFTNTTIEQTQALMAGSITVEQAMENINQRAQELVVRDGDLRLYLTRVLYSFLGGMLEDTRKYSTVNNVGATYDRLLEALRAKEVLTLLLEASGWTDVRENFHNLFCRINTMEARNEKSRDKKVKNEKSIAGFITNSDRIRMFQIFMERTLIKKIVDGQITAEGLDQLEELRQLLDIKENFVEEQSRTQFGPTVAATMKKAKEEIMANYTQTLVDNLKQEIDEEVTRYRLDDQFVQSTGGKMYNAAVTEYYEMSPGGIPSEEMMETLKVLKDVMKVTDEAVYATNLRVFGEVYKKSVLESMALTGIISKELRENLDKLRVRLGLDEEAARLMYNDAIGEKMKPMVEWIESEMERSVFTQQQLSQRRQKDVGEDYFKGGKGESGTLGLGSEINVLNDILNLIDFYTENEVKTVDEDGNDDYPVTALEIKAVDDETAAALYRQFVVGMFTTQGPNAQRYEDNKEVFAKILGLPVETTDEIDSSIGNTVYDNYVSQSMQSKGILDQQDMMFLANLQVKLGLNDTISEKFMRDAQVKVLSVEGGDIMDDPTPETVKAFREKCDSLGFDLVNDIGLSRSSRNQMYETEIKPLIVSGELTPEGDNGKVIEIAESLGLSELEAETEFGEIVMKLGARQLSQLESKVNRGRKLEAIEHLKFALQLARFVDGELGCEYMGKNMDIQVQNAIMDAFEMMDKSEVEDEAADKALLLKILGLKESPELAAS